ncbi:MAG TPA: hypothetical protein VGN96_17570 [Roseococcus sp.]|jgi:hypothetical protein|nr:hypothetical protein [Roseococcus sp.]
MGSLADGVALLALVLVSAIYVAAFVDEVDPDWSARSLKERVLAMPALTGVLLAVWIMALLGGAGWPGQLAAWVAGWSFAAVLTVAAVAGAVVALAGLGLLLKLRFAGPGLALPRQVAAAQLGLALLVLGAGVAQAAVGSH